MKHPTPPSPMQQAWQHHCQRAEQLPGLTDADLAALYASLPAPAPHPTRRTDWLAAGASAAVGIFSAYQWVLLRESRSYAILLTLFTLSALLLTLMALPVRGRGRGAGPSLAPFGTLFLDGIFALSLTLVATLSGGDGYTMFTQACNRADVSNQIVQLITLSA